MIAHRWAIAALGAVLALFAWTASHIAPTVEHVLVPSAINHDGGFAFAIALPPRDDWIFYVRSDGQEGSAVSRLELLEDGKSLGLRHAPHEEIRQKGGGRYSHWNGKLWFSASDASDPRTSGRTYHSQVKKSLRPVWAIAGALGAAAAVLVLLWSAAAALASSPPDSRVSTMLRRIGSAVRPVESSRAVSLTTLAVGALVGGIATVLGWHFGDITTTGLGVTRYFPVSDAFGYHSCATSIAASGQFDEPFGAIWCSRRAIYPSMLAGILAIAGWNAQLTLVIQGAMTGASIAALGLVLALAFSPPVALLAAGVLSVYAWEFVLGLYMTEAAGFVLGLTGLALLISYCMVGRERQLFAGVGFVSVGLAARAGAVSVLPALAAWSAVAFPEMSRKQRAGLVAGTVLAVAIGPILQVVLVVALGADPSNTGGNFSTSLYGLSTGSRDWSQAYRDFAPLFAQSESEAFRHIYAVAVTNIREQPHIFLAALAGAGHLYATTLFDFGVLVPFGALLSALVVLGIARCCLTIGTPLSRLALIVGLAELLVAPLIIDSGGTRVFAATAGVRVLFLAIGAQWLVSLLDSWFRADAVHSVPPENRWAAGSATAIAVFVLLLTLLPVTPVGLVARLERVRGNGCPQGLVEVVARIGRETQYMVVSDESPNVHSVVPFDVGRGRLRADTRIASTWFGKDFLELAPPMTILRAVDLASPDSAAVKPLFFRGVMHDQWTPKSLCVDASSYIDLAGVRHFEIKSVQPLAAARGS